MDDAGGFDDFEDDKLQEDEEDDDYFSINWGTCAFVCSLKVLIQFELVSIKINLNL